MSVEVPGGEPASRWGQVALSALGVVVAVWGAAVLAVAGAFLTPYRVGGALVPISLVLVLVGNAALLWYVYAVTGSKPLALLPGLVWLALSFFGADKTAEGDLVLVQNNWVATVYLIVGCVAIAGMAYYVFLPPVRLRKPPPA